MVSDAGTVVVSAAVPNSRDYTCDLPASARGSRRAVTLPAGTEIAVLTNESIDATSAAAGKTYSADVAQDITNSAGQVVIPKGSPAELVIRKVAAGGVTSNPEVTLELQSVK